MRRIFPPALAILVISLYGALGWQHLVADSNLVAPRAAQSQQAAAPIRYAFERGGRRCAMPSWRH